MRDVRVLRRVGIVVMVVQGSVVIEEGKVGRTLVVGVKTEEVVTTVVSAVELDWMVVVVVSTEVTDVADELRSTEV